MPDRCIWVLSGSPEGYVSGTVERLPEPDAIIAANGGSALAAHLGLTPTLVIGDLDSADPKLIEQWAAQGVELRRFEHTVKLETDTELAVMAAVERLDVGRGTIYVLNAIGGRLDHALANVLLLTRLDFRQIDLRLVEANQILFLAKPGRWNTLTGEEGDLITLLPVGTEVTGVRLEGCVYPLSGETLRPGYGQGVSNEIAGSPARVRFDSGLLLVALTNF